MKAQEVAEILISKYDWVKFPFGIKVGTEVHAFRYLISCILVGGSLERNTLACMDELVQKYPDAYELGRADFKELVDMLESHELRFAGNKAKNIIKTADLLRSRHNGRVPDTRNQLEALPGVGRHVASVILATVHGQNEFGVDVHVRRITQRLGLVEATKNDRRVEDAVVKAVAPELLGHFSRSFVDFGQNICSYTPKCDICPFATDCPSYKKSPTGKVATDKAPDSFNVDVADGEYEVAGNSKTYKVTVSEGVARCSCKAARFGQRCYHIGLVKED